MIRVVVADDHEVVRAGLAQLIGTFEGVELAGAAANGLDAVALCASARPDVALLDVEMPLLDGIAATRRIAQEVPGTAVVLFTSFSDRDRVVHAMDAGAAGYLLKDADPHELRRAIEAAAEGGNPLAPKAAAQLLAPGPAPRGSASQLSAREREVLLLLTDGLANKQIARRLAISEKTVKGHMTRIFQALGVTDRTQAALWAERSGWRAAEPSGSPS